MRQIHLRWKRPLQPNVRRATSRSSSTAATESTLLTWDLGPEPPTGEVDAGVVGSTARRLSWLPSGRYAREHDNGEVVFIDLFPEGAVRFSYDGEQRWGMYGSSHAERSDVHRLRGSGSGWAAWFNPVSGEASTRLPDNARSDAPLDVSEREG